MAIAFDDFVKVLHEFSISSSDDLRQRLTAVGDHGRHTSTDWHDGYVQGFTKAHTNEISLLNQKFERVDSRIRDVERGIKDVDRRVEDLAKPASPAPRISRSRKSGRRK